LLALVAVLAVPSTAAAATRCEDVGPPTERLAWRAQVIDKTPVRRYLARPESRQAALDPAIAEAVLVLDARVDASERCWLRVRLPSRPNASSGWIKADRVRLRSTPWRIVVDRSRRTVTLLRDGRRVARATAVIGTGATPTPTGLFAIASVWRNRPNDFLGSWILALSAHSEVLKTFDGGDGRVALHGRGGASLSAPLGSAASHGCVRLANADIDRIVRRVGPRTLPGTPVRVS
jgi:hypothetical protein